jgi:TolB-like protein/Tfp pilus assembly protein PilF
VRLFYWENIALAVNGSRRFETKIMAEKGKKLIRIDLDQFKMRIKISDNVDLSLHFDSPSRRFYFSVIALVVHEMQKLGKITSIPLEEHYEALVLLNQTVGGSAGSSKKKKLISRIYKKWKSALPDLENAPLFRVLGKAKEYGDTIGRAYSFFEEEKDLWANLFEYRGSEEQVRLQFSVDKLGASLNDVVIAYKEDVNHAGGSAWDGFLDTLEKERIEKQAQEQEQALAEPSRAHPRQRKWLALSVLIGVILLAGPVLIWNFYFRPPPIDPASLERMAFPLPDKPSIAVLPFVNMSEDSEMEYFCDGLTEEIITALSQLPEMFVIARNSTFTYKGNPVKVRQAAEDLGVRYVLEGSVRRAGERVRVTAQFSDALSGNHLWAERYERELKDIFAVQDEITVKILSIFEVKLLGRRLTRYPVNLDVYMRYLQAKEYIDRGTPADYSKARHLLEESISLDPEFIAAYRRLAWAHLLEYYSGQSESPRESIKQAYEFAKKGLTMDESNAQSHRTLAAVCVLKKDYERSISLLRKGLELDPNDAYLAMSMAWCLIKLQRPEEAIPFAKRAMRLNPLDQKFHSKCLLRLGTAYRKMGRYEEAISAYEKAVQIRPKHWSSWLGLAGAYGLAGREEDARYAAKQLLGIHPKFSLEKHAKKLPDEDQAAKNSVIEALRKAGLK